MYEKLCQKLPETAFLDYTVLRTENYQNLGFSRLIPGEYIKIMIAIKILPHPLQFSNI